MPVNKLLIISNGNGEDAIAAEIARRLPKSIEVNAYPTFGDGRAYEGVCPVVGPRRHIEGHRRRRSLISDILAGLGIGPSLSFIRTEAKNYDGILVVGDTLGVVMCWFARRRVRVYLDVLKSGYDGGYSRSDTIILRRSVDLVLTRDEILARQLVGEKVNARFVGNAIMDTVESGHYDPRWHRRNLRAITIIPGSRASLVGNFKAQLDALRRVPGIEGIDVFAVLARPGNAQDIADASGLRLSPPPQRLGDLGTLTDGRVKIHLSTRSLGAVVAISELVLGQDGTAPLQAMGLGKPVVSFEDGAMEAVAGEARVVAPRDPEAMAATIARLLADSEDRKRRGAIGRERMGPPGAIQAIIDELTR